MNSLEKTQEVIVDICRFPQSILFIQAADRKSYQLNFEPKGTNIHLRSMHAVYLDNTINQLNY